MKLKVFVLLSAMFLLIAGITFAQSGSTGGSTSSGATGSSAATSAATSGQPGAAPGAAANTSFGNANPSGNSGISTSLTNNNTSDFPQPTLVTPANNDTTGLNGLNGNFNNVQQVDQFGNTLNNNFNSTTGFNNTGLTTTTDQFGNQVIVDQFGNRVDQFGNPVMNTGTVMINGIPVTVNNPFANPFNTGIVLDQTGLTTLSTLNQNAALANPNLPLNVVTSNTRLTNANGGVIDASDFANGIQFPAVTVSNAPQGATAGVPAPVFTRGFSTNTNNNVLTNQTKASGITRRNDGTFTNEKN